MIASIGIVEHVWLDHVLVVTDEGDAGDVDRDLVLVAQPRAIIARQPPTEPGSHPKEGGGIFTECATAFVTPAQRHSRDHVAGRGEFPAGRDAQLLAASYIVGAALAKSRLGVIAALRREAAQQYYGQIQIQQICTRRAMPYTRVQHAPESTRDGSHHPARS